MINTMGGNSHDISSTPCHLGNIRDLTLLDRGLTNSTDAPLFQPGFKLILIEQHYLGTRPAVSGNVLSLVQAGAGHSEKLSSFG